jgi:DNA-directed RNA polymerase specialized sigma24 family protein
MSVKTHYEKKYSKEEKEIVRAAVKELQGVRKIAIYLRFWENLTIAEVAKTMGLSWAEANILIDDCVREIRIKYFPNAKCERQSW